MKTNNNGSVASNILNHLLQLIGVALFYWALIYTTIHYWLFGFLHRVAKVRYEAGPNFTRELYLLLLIFSIFCYLANRFLLDIYHRRTVKQLTISILIDYLIWPLGLTIIILYDNINYTTVADNVSKLFNIYVITALLIIKNVIAVKILSKAGKGGKLNYKAQNSN
jgi:hypothetical protein